MSILQFTALAAHCIRLSGVAREALFGGAVFCGEAAPPEISTSSHVYYITIKP